MWIFFRCHDELREFPGTRSWQLRDFTWAAKGGTVFDEPGYPPGKSEINTWHAVRNISKATPFLHPAVRFVKRAMDAMNAVRNEEAAPTNGRINVQDCPLLGNARLLSIFRWRLLIQPPPRKLPQWRRSRKYPCKWTPNDVADRPGDVDWIPGSRIQRQIRLSRVRTMASRLNQTSTKEERTFAAPSEGDMVKLHLSQPTSETTPTFWSS